MNGLLLTRRAGLRFGSRRFVKSVLGLLICFSLLMALAGCSGRRRGAEVSAAHAVGSRSAEYYWAQSRPAISRDGRYVIFDSDMELENTGLNNYSDVYMIKVR